MRKTKKKNAKKRVQKLQQKNNQQSPQQQKGKQKNNKKGQQKGQCPQGSLKKQQSDCRKDCVKYKAIDSYIARIEAMKKDERSNFEKIALGYLKFYRERRFIEIFYYSLFAIIVPLSLVYLNMAFIVFECLKINISLLFNLKVFTCTFIIFAGVAILLGSAICLQHMLVKSSKSNKKVNIALAIIISWWFLKYPGLTSLPVIQKFASCGDILKKVVEFVL